MPKDYGFGTGGKFPGKPLSEYEDTSGNTVEVGASGAGMGTTQNQPNVKERAAPGGYGSTGKASDSSAT